MKLPTNQPTVDGVEVSVFSAVFVRVVIKSAIMKSLGEINYPCLQSTECEDRQ